MRPDIESKGGPASLGRPAWAVPGLAARQAVGMRESKLLGLPSFALGVFILYWSLPLGVLLGRIKHWKVWGKRDDAFGW